MPSLTVIVLITSFWKYKHDIKNPEMITRELKRCADELASCDLTMQTIRNLIQEGGD